MGFLLWRILATALTVFAAVILPYHAFFAESHDATEIRSSVLDTISAVVGGVWHSPGMAIGVAWATGFLVWLFLRRFSTKKYITVLDDLRAFMRFFDEKFHDDILGPLVGGNGELSEDKYKLFTDRSRELLAKLCSRVAEAFTTLTRDKCCATLKIYNSETGEISTRARDLGQPEYGSRHDVDRALPAFDYRQNTAFQEIIDGEKDFYKSNWLPFLALFEFYKNQNPNWMQWYQATVVLPLFVTEEGNSRIVGFLCVDNLKGRFRKKLARAVLQAYAVPAEDVIMLLGRVRQEE
jgi:hypothetical protein